MDLRERLKRGLVFSRDFTLRLLEDFRSPEEWITPAVDGGNHALWIAGHLAVADDAFTSYVDASASDRRDIYRERFGRGSQPVYSLGHYDAPEVIVDYLHARRAAFLGTLESLPEERFSDATPDGAPPFMYDLASMYQMTTWHESLHTGQLTAIRRKVGHGPVV